MKLISQQGDRRFWLLRLEPPYEARLQRFVGPFVAIVVACDSSITPEQQANLSAQLVAVDCRYMLAWGANASSWDDSVDMAFIRTDPNFDPPSDRFVMTTWHDNETIQDVVWFALTNTTFDSHDFRDYLALMIGEDPEIEAELVAAIQRQLAAQ